MFNQKKLDFSFDVFKALAHPIRIEILNFISSKGSTNVQSIYNALDLPQSVTSQQLKILKDSKLVVSKTASKERIYSINFSIFQLVQSVLEKKL